MLTVIGIFFFLFAMGAMGHVVSTRTEIRYEDDDE
jgi:hypothetical protein